MSANHTPGPWITNPYTGSYQLLSSNGPFPNERLAAIRKLGLGEFTALSIGTKGGQVAIIPLDESNEANGRLIAATPELLWCLEELLVHIEWRRRVAGEVAGENDCTHRARAAIAKATGAA